MDWVKGIQDAISYIEDNITEELDYQEISRRAFVSSFHFQRIFSILCGYTLGEYIRNRRLTLAGEELTAGTLKVIDAAVKYGYDSPDSFTRAFTRFHGIRPSSVRDGGVRLKSFTPLKIKLALEGGSTVEFRIDKKDAFTVMGVERNFAFETSYADIPEFWTEHFANGGGRYVRGMFGICFDENNDGKTFKYMIADIYNSPQDIPEGYVTKTIAAATWVVFPCVGALPDALQDVNTKIWNEWLPNCREYELAGNYSFEMYSEGNTSSDDYYSEIWVPVKSV